MFLQVVLLALLCLPGGGSAVTQAERAEFGSGDGASASVAQRRHKHRRRGRAGRRRKGEARVTADAPPPADANANSTNAPKSPPARPRRYDPVKQPPESAPTPTPTRPPAGA